MLAVEGATATDLTMEDIYNMVGCSQKRLEENAMLEKKLVKFRPFSEESLSNDADLKFYT